MNNKTLIVGNWKMHLTTHEASLLAHRLNEHIKAHHDIEIVLAPSMLTLQPLSLEIDRRKFRLAAQNANEHDQGAYTGEVSFTMLHDLVHYSLIGHSERRLYFNETHEVVRDKVAAAIRNDITPIICIGETHVERKAGETFQVVHDQLSTALSRLTSTDAKDIVIAYEPVWAISTFGGELAKPADVEPVLKRIRDELSDLFGEKVASSVRIIYGGSVDEHLASGYLDMKNCDGLLAGSASLNYKKFTAIVDAAYKLHHKHKD